MNRKLNIQFIAINEVWRYGNIGIDQLAGYLRTKDFNVSLNYFGKKSTIDSIFDKIDKTGDVYGFSVTTANYQRSCGVASKIKTINPSAFIFFGGGLVSRYYREILKENPFLDYCILGDGEIPTEQLLNAIKNDNISNFSHVSVATQQDTENKRFQINTEIPREPAYDYYINDSRPRNSRKTHCIQSKNNVCTGNCTFCTERHGKISYRDIDVLVYQIKKVFDNYGVRKFFFTDDNLLDPNDDFAKHRVLDLCQRIKDLHIPIALQCYIKANSLKDDPFDHALLATMHDVGFVEIFVGIESGNQQDLDLYNKKTTVEDNHRTISMLRQHGIFPLLGFISFNPYSTLDSITTNFNFLCDHQCTFLFNYLYSFVIVNKYTEMYNRIKRDGLLCSPESQYLNVKYSYAHPECVDILDYVRYNMVPRLNALDYHLDWVTYSYLEHKIWYSNIPNYDKRLQELKQINLNVIRRYLSILFIQHDLKAFINVADEFWNHFESLELELEKIYSSLVSLHDQRECKT